MRDCKNTLYTPIDAQDGRVACSPSMQENKAPMAISSLIAVRKVTSFAVPPTGNKAAIEAFSDALESSIDVYCIVKEGNVASSPSPHVKNKISTNM